MSDDLITFPGLPKSELSISNPSSTQTKMKHEISIFRPGEDSTVLSEDLIRKQALYNQPEFAELIKPGKFRYGKLETEEETVFFPFTTDRILLRRRVFMLPYCQRFTPFSLNKKNAKKEQTELWLEWLQKNCINVSWAFSSDLEIPGTQARINQMLQLNRSFDSILASWNGDRRNALNRSKDLQVEHLSAIEFSNHLKNINQQKSGKGWQPNRQEEKSIQSISDSSFFSAGLQRFGVFSGNECLSLVLLLTWHGRRHYLFAQSTETGFRKEALTRFFHRHFQDSAGTEMIFDFEGSSIPGVQSFFKSLGAEKEVFFEFRKAGGIL